MSRAGEVYENPVTGERAVVRVGTEETGGELHENVAWTYRESLHDAVAVAGYVAFFNERVEIEVDGEIQEQPASMWSAPGWWNRIREIEAQL
jgi:hypothetical protein